MFCGIGKQVFPPAAFFRWLCFLPVLFWWVRFAGDDVLVLVFSAARVLVLVLSAGSISVLALSAACLFGGGVLCCAGGD